MSWEIMILFSLRLRAQTLRGFVLGGQTLGDRRLEILAPAGDREKLVMAVTYGADAVYLAGPAYGMRAGAGTFGPEDMTWAVGYCHSRGVKVYVTVNTIPTDEQMDALPGYLETLEAARADGLIVSDVGVLTLAKKYAPTPPSTSAPRRA